MYLNDLKLLESTATPGPWEWCLGSGQNVGTGVHAPYAPNAMGHSMVADFNLLEWDIKDGGTERATEDHRPDMNLTIALRNLAPELLALWEACNTEEIHACLGDIAQEALAALNRKAATLQP